MADPFPDHITGSANLDIVSKKLKITDLVYNQERYSSKEIIKSIYIPTK